MFIYNYLQVIPFTLDEAWDETGLLLFGYVRSPVLFLSITISVLGTGLFAFVVFVLLRSSFMKAFILLITAFNSSLFDSFFVLLFLEDIVGLETSKTLIYQSHTNQNFSLNISSQWLDPLIACVQAVNARSEIDWHSYFAV